MRLCPGPSFLAHQGSDVAAVEASQEDMTIVDHSFRSWMSPNQHFAPHRTLANGLIPGELLAVG